MLCCAAIFFVSDAIYHGILYRRLRNRPYYDIADLHEMPVPGTKRALSRRAPFNPQQITAIRGQVVVLEEELTAPLSGTPCVWFRFRALRRLATNPYKREAVIEDQRQVVFGLKDGTGVLRISVDRAHPDDTFETSRTDPLTLGESARLEKAYGYSPSDSNIRYKEQAIRPGDTLFLLGRVVYSIGAKLEFDNPQLRLHVDKFGEGQLLEHFKGRILGSSVLAVLSMSGAATLGYFAFASG